MPTPSRLLMTLSGIRCPSTANKKHVSNTDNNPEIGAMVLTSAVVSSRYGDEKLFFRHNTART